MKEINNNDIFVTDFSKISMTTNLLQLKTPKGEVALDIHKLLNQDINSSDAYFNATQIAKLFGTKYAFVTRGKNWENYVKIIERKINYRVANLQLGNKAHSLGLSNKDLINEDGTLKAVVIKKGGNQNNKKGDINLQGTWLHYKLAIEFVGLLNLEWKAELHEFMEKLIKHTVNLKDNRLKTKTEFRNLTDAIKEHYVHTLKSPTAKKYAYAKIADMVNLIVVGATAKNYKKEFGISDRIIILHGAISIRDFMMDDELKTVYEVEQTIARLLDNGTTSYHSLFIITKALFTNDTKVYHNRNDFRGFYDGYTDEEYKQELNKSIK